MVNLGQKFKFKKYVEIHSKNHSELFCAKNRCKKLEIFAKWDHFESRPSRKRYSSWKMVSLGQKLKFQTACQNSFYKSFTVVLCKKPLQKTRNIPEMRLFWKSGIMHTLEPMQNGQFGSNIKIEKNISKSTNYSRNEKTFKIGYHAKAIAHGKWLVWVKN